MYRYLISVSHTFKLDSAIIFSGSSKWEFSMIHLPLLINPLPFMYTTSRFRPLSLTDDRTDYRFVL